MPEEIFHNFRPAKSAVWLIFSSIEKSILKLKNCIIFCWVVRQRNARICRCYVHIRTDRAYDYVE